MKIAFQIELPDELAQEFLQTIRNFDVKHDPNHMAKVKMRLWTKSGHTIAEMEEIFRSLNPMPEFMKTFKFDS